MHEFMHAYKKERVETFLIKWRLFSLSLFDTSVVSSNVLWPPADGEGDIPGHPALLVKPGDDELGVQVLLLQELLDPLLVHGVEGDVVLEPQLAVEEPALRGLEHLLLDDGHDAVEPRRGLALREACGKDPDRVLDVAEVLEAANLCGIVVL